MCCDIFSLFNNYSKLNLLMTRIKFTYEIILNVSKNDKKKSSNFHDGFVMMCGMWEESSHLLMTDLKIRKLFIFYNIFVYKKKLIETKIPS